MLNVNTDLLKRLKARDSAAWYELWDVFGPSIERIVGSIAHRYFSQETIRDVSQETMARVFANIDSFNARRGVKFSTWLYAIARHVVLTELTMRGAQKRNAGVRPQSLDELEHVEVADHDVPPDFEVSVFRAKVLRAMDNVKPRVDLLEFEAYRMKMSEGLSGKEIARQLGVSEPTVSRYLRRVREELRHEIALAVAAYSLTESEAEETGGAGLDRVGDDEFDAALCEVYLNAENERKSYSRLGATARLATG